jgi:hypothetical protein
MQQFDGEGIVDFAAKAGHLHVDDVIDWSETGGLAPDISCEHLAGDCLVAILEQIKKQIVLAGSQVNGSSGAADEMSLRIDVDVRNLQRGRARRRRKSAQQRGDACEELREREWLAKIIVCAGVETGDAIVDGVVGGKDENSCGELLGSDLCEDFESATLRQSKVKQYEIGLSAMNEEEGLLTSASEGDLITVTGETGDEVVRHSAIVFDDEYAA